jgi:hypothetical protein
MTTASYFEDSSFLDYMRDNKFLKMNFAPNRARHFGLQAHTVEVSSVLLKVRPAAALHTKTSASPYKERLKTKVNSSSLHALQNDVTYRKLAMDASTGL